MKTPSKKMASDWCNATTDQGTPKTRGGAGEGRAGIHPSQKQRGRSSPKATEECVVLPTPGSQTSRPRTERESNYL